MGNSASLQDDPSKSGRSNVDAECNRQSSGILPNQTLHAQLAEDARQESEEIIALCTRERRSLSLTENCFGGFFLELMRPRPQHGIDTSFETLATSVMNASECEISPENGKYSRKSNVEVAISMALLETGDVEVPYQKFHAPVSSQSPEIEKNCSVVFSNHDNASPLEPRRGDATLAVIDECHHRRGTTDFLDVGAIAAACSAPADTSISDSKIIPTSPSALVSGRQLSPFSEEYTYPHQGPASSRQLTFESPECWKEEKVSVEASYEDGVETLEPSFRPESPRSYYHSMGDCMEQQGRLLEALECYQRCLDLDDEIETTIDDSAVVYLKMGMVHWKMGSYGESLAVLQFIVSIYEHAIGHSWLEGPAKLSGSRAVISAEAFLIIGRVHLSLGNGAEARSHVKQSLAILGSAQIDPSLAQAVYAKALHSLGMTFSACGRDNKAMRYFLEALRLHRGIYGGQHVDIAASLASIGAVHEKNGKLDKAMTSFMESLHIYRSCSLVNSSQVNNDIGVTLSRVGWIHFINGDYTAAMEAYQESLGILLHLGRHRNVASIILQIGMTHRKCCRFGEALQMYKRALKVQREALGDKNLDLAITLEEIGSAYTDLNRFDRAITSFEQALHIRHEVQGKKHMDCGMTYTHLGGIYLRTKNKRLAKQCYSNGLRIFKKNHLSSDDYRMQKLSNVLHDLRKT